MVLSKVTIVAGAVPMGAMIAAPSVVLLFVLFLYTARPNSTPSVLVTRFVKMVWAIESFVTCVSPDVPVQLR